MTKKFKSAYVPINNVPTNIITYGRWIEESNEDIQEVVICITGNPGLPGFYTNFCETIHENIDANIPIWIIGHAGHDEPPSTSLLKTPDLEGNKKLYDLKGQIEHKISFIENYVPKNAKIHLIGHSIGAWIVLQLLKTTSIRNRVKKSYLLFPTIERMAISPNGKIFEFSRNFVPIYIFILKLLLFLPTFFRVFIIYIYFWLFSIPKCYARTALNYSKPTAMEKVIFLAKDEMDTVCNLELDHVKNVKDSLKMYYGTTDGWVPVEYYTEIKKNIPDLDAELCVRKIDHSFVLRYSDAMGNIVSKWINESK